MFSKPQCFPSQARGRGRGRRGRGGRASGARGRGPLDETRDDNAQAFSANLGKWSKRAVTWVSRKEFWCCLNISYKFSCVLEVLQAQIMKVPADGEIHNLTRLTCGGADQVGSREEQNFAKKKFDKSDLENAAGCSLHAVRNFGALEFGYHKRTKKGRSAFLMITLYKVKFEISLQISRFP